MPGSLRIGKIAGIDIYINGERTSSRWQESEREGSRRNVPGLRWQRGSTEVGRSWNMEGSGRGYRTYS